jgi:hypothetical protein
VIGDVHTRANFAKYRGRLRGMAVLSTPPPVIDIERFETGTPRRTDEELRALAEDVIVPPPGPDPYFSGLYPPPPANPEVLIAEDKLAFYVEEGAAVVLESSSGCPGAVPVIAITPEHYIRIVPRARARHPRRGGGRGAQPPRRSRHRSAQRGRRDPRHRELVMLGAHFDTWHASPNASDNTSGIAVMLEAMRILKAVGAAPRRTIRVALWSSEEQGL